MANTNSPFGFRPVIRAGGSPFSTVEYAKPASDVNTIYQYDIVNKVAGAVTLPESPTGYKLPTIETGYQGMPGTTLWQGASLNYGAASTLTVHMVADQPDVIFIGQAKTGVVIATAAHVGKNANISQSTAGSTTTKQSGMAVDSGTIAATASLDLRITRVAMISPNAEGDSAILEVLINKHEFGQQTAGV